MQQEAERRHPKIWNLGHVGRTPTEAALGRMLSVDPDIVDVVEEIKVRPRPASTSGERRFQETL